MKDGETTPLPMFATAEAVGACKYASDRHRSMVGSKSAGAAPAFTQTVCEHPVRISNAGAKSQNAPVRRIPIISGAIQQLVYVERRTVPEIFAVSRQKHVAGAPALVAQHGQERPLGIELRGITEVCHDRIPN